MFVRGDFHRRMFPIMVGIRKQMAMISRWRGKNLVPMKL